MRDTGARVPVQEHEAQLPEGWIACDVGKVFKSFGGGTPNRATARFWNGSIPWLSSGDIKADRIDSSSETITEAGLENSSANMCREGSVVVVVRSGILARMLPVAVIGLDAAINQDIKCFDSGNESLNEWLALAFRCYAKDILSLNRDGTTVQSVRYETLKDFQLKVPPQAEQRRIIDTIQAASRHVSACRERLAKISKLMRAFRRSVISAACSGFLTDDWRKSRKMEHASVLVERLSAKRRTLAKKAAARYKEPFLPSTDAIGEVPDEWALVSVDSLTSRITSGSRDWKRYYTNEGPGTFVMAQNIRPLRFDNAYRLGVDPPDGDRDRNRSEIRRNDVLVTIVGANTGDVCRVPFDVTEHYVCQSVALMRPVMEEISPFLELFLNSPAHGQAQYRHWMYGEGRPHLSFDQLRATAIALPPLEEQVEIVRRTHALWRLADKIEQRVAAAALRAEQLERGVLARAFQGDLVPTEASLARQDGRAYEPASRLIERITLAASGNNEPVNGKQKSATRRRSRNGKGSRTKVRL